jgi:hypothetical protein
MIGMIPDIFNQKRDDFGGKGRFVDLPRKFRFLYLALPAPSV